jgi:hypothetical protein
MLHGFVQFFYRHFFFYLHRPTLAVIALLSLVSVGTDFIG